MPLLEVVGKGDNNSPEQIGAICVKIGANGCVPVTIQAQVVVSKVAVS